MSALKHVAGYTCFCDGSVRDFIKLSLITGKNFPATSPLGPWMVTADEIPDPSKLTLTTRLNGTADAAFRHRHDDARRARADRLVLDLHAAFARRHHCDRHARRHRRPAQPAGLDESRRRSGSGDFRESAHFAPALQTSASRSVTSPREIPARRSVLPRDRPIRKPGATGPALRSGRGHTLSCQVHLPQRGHRGHIILPARHAEPDWLPRHRRASRLRRFDTAYANSRCDSRSPLAAATRNHVTASVMFLGTPFPSS